MSKTKNYISIGLKSDKKLKNSFYSFLYDKHIDWAIILAAFFTPLPYISSKNYLLLIVKTFSFSLIVYFCLRYILNWKKLQVYYKTYERANHQSKSLIDKEKLKDKGYENYRAFNKNFISELETLGKSFKENNDSSTFQEYISKYPENARPLENLLNKDLKLTKTAFGVTMNVITSIFHLRGIPANELKNYRRLLLIILFTVVFFFAYAVEISFL